MPLSATPSNSQKRHGQLPRRPKRHQSGARAVHTLCTQVTANTLAPIGCIRYTPHHPVDFQVVVLNMLLLQTFPLSVAIFWRFMLVLPLWTLFYIFLTAITFYGFFTILIGIPVIGLLLLVLIPVVSTIISYIISMHPYLIGIRIGLRVLGHKTEHSQHKLMIAAVGYGFIEGLVAVLLSAVIFAAWLMVQQGDIEQVRAILHAQVPDPVASLSQQVAFGRYTALTAISGVVALLLRAALLPTLASVSAGRNHRPYDEFGAKLPLMVLLLLMITAVSTIMLPLMGTGASYLGLTQALVSHLDRVILFVTGKGGEFTMLHAFVIAGSVCVGVWLFCLQCAGAALAHSGETVRPSKPSSKHPPISTDDISALRRARMGKKQ